MSQRHILALACVILFGLGVLGSALGPSLDHLSEKTDSSLGDTGTLVTMVFVGALLTQFMIGPFIDRWGQRPVLLAGALILAPAAVGVSFSPVLGVLLAFGLIWGLGFGALDVTSNVMVSETFRGNVGVMNLLHVFFGVGSVIGPALVSASLFLANDAVPALWIGAVIMLLTVPVILRLPRSLGVIETEKLPEGTGQFSYRVPLLWGLGALMLLYVGLETGLGAWTTAYLKRSTSLSEETAALATSGFWFALTGGRLAGAIWGNRFTAYQVLWVSLLGTMAGALLMAVSTGHAAITVSAVLIAGFFSGPPFPTVIGITTEAFPAGPGRAAAVVTALGGVGGAILPWIQGQLLDNITPEASVIFVGVMAVLMVALYAGIRAQAERRARRRRRELAA